MFDKYWEQYPKKVGKANAKKSFTKINPDDELFNKIMASLEHQKTTWTELKFIPHASTWLNGERWNDEVDKPFSEIFDYNQMLQETAKLTTSERAVWNSNHESFKQNEKLYYRKVQ